MRTITPLTALVALLLAAPSCEKKAPATPAPPTTRRIAALSPAVGVILRDLGRGDEVVARSAYEMVLDEKLPSAGDQLGIDYEALLASRPTHVFTQWGARELPPRLVALAKEHDWTLRDFRLLALDDIPASVVEIESALGNAHAPRAKELTQNMTRSWSRRDGLAKAGRVLMLASVEPLGALGPGSFHQQLLERLGATPAIAVGREYITLDREDLLRLSPDAIILWLPRPPRTPPPATPLPPADAEKLLASVASPTTPAFARHRVAVIDHPLAHVPSPALAEISDELAAILERWARE